MAHALERRGRWPVVVAAAAILTGCALCLPDWLIIRHRAAFQSAYPDAAAAWALNGPYAALPNFDDSDMYAARVGEAARSLWPGDPHIKENRSRRLAWTDGLTFLILGLFARAAGGVSAGLLWARFACAGAWVLLLYALVAGLSPNRRWSLACAVALTLFFDLIAEQPWAGVLAWARQVAGHVFWLLGHYHYNFGVGRTPRPELTYLPLLAGLALAGRARSRAAAIALGALMGALIEFHLDAWAVGLGTLALWTAGESLRERRLAAGPTTALLVAVAVSALPAAVLFPAPPELLARAELEFSRWPSLVGLGWLALGAFAWTRCQGSAPGRALSCAVAACGLGLQAQCLTGYNIHAALWNDAAQLLALAGAAGWAGRRLPRQAPALTLAFAAWLVAVGRAAGYAGQRYPFQGLPRDWAAAFDYLRLSAPPGSVVAALGPVENTILPAFTASKTLVGTGFVLVSDLPLEAELARLGRALRLFRVPRSRLIEGLRTRREPPNLALARGAMDWQGREWALFPGADWSAASVLSALERGGLPADLSAEADYLWVGPFERGLMAPGAERRLGKPLFRAGEIALYAAPR